MSEAVNTGSSQSWTNRRFKMYFIPREKEGELHLFKCPSPKCSYSAVSSNDIYSHYRERHQRTEVIIKCPECPKIFIDIKSLVKHHSLKHGKKPIVKPYFVRTEQTQL
jgi:uncharacterized C2H2 Zn-finger protein